jgi:2-methylcitrate dehydratase PrpD
MSLTRSLVDAVQALEYKQFTASDRLAVQMLLLDHLGVVANGAQTETTAAVRRYAALLPESEGPRLPLIGTGGDAPAVTASLINAVAGHCIEYDDTHSASSSHPGVVIIPAALAAAKIVDADDETFVTGVVVGYEVMCRVGRAANPSSHYARHFHPTATVGTIGAAAAASTIFGLDTERMVSALGIACDTAAGSMQFIVDGAWTKRLHPGVAVRSGIEAARLAQVGFLGTEDGIGGERGFLAGYSADAQPDLLMAEWGIRPLEVNNTSIKAHTCCRYNQGSIDALIDLRQTNDLGAQDVDTIELGVPTVAVDIVVEPKAAKRRPKTVVDAQFSLPYAAAAAIVHGRAGLAQYDEALLDDGDLVALMDRVQAVVDPELDRAYPEQWRAWARVTTIDGRELFSEVPDPKGDPANPLTHSELRDKFDELAAPAYGPESRQEIVEAVERIGEPGSLAGLLATLGSDTD